MNLKNFISKKAAESEIDAKGTSGGSDDSATNEGIEVQAIEFDKLKYSKVEDSSRSPRKSILFVLAVVVILFGSAITGFTVLRSKKKSALTEESNFSSVDSTSTENISSEVTTPQGEGLNSIDRTEASESTSADASQPLTSAGNEESTTIVEPPIEVDTSAEFASNTDTHSEPQPGNNNISSEAVESEKEANPWNDPTCPNHNLDVSSYCSGGASGSISIASFCFGSKRDGDWYWIRSSAGAATAYDSWDYTEETNGQLTINDLKGGDSYIISLVRDSMQPYDEIISHEFTVPECQ